MVPRMTTRVATADQSGSGGWFGSLFSSSGSQSNSSGMVDRVSRAVGLRGSEPTAAAKGPKAKPAAAKPTQTASAARPKQQAEPQATANPRPQTQEANASPTPTGGGSLMSGAQPTVPTGTFEGRFGAWR
jgi:hypothetical protein